MSNCVYKERIKSAADLLANHATAEMTEEQRNWMFDEVLRILIGNAKFKEIVADWQERDKWVFGEKPNLEDYRMPEEECFTF